MAIPFQISKFESSNTIEMNDQKGVISETKYPNGRLAERHIRDDENGVKIFQSWRANGSRELETRHAGNGTVVRREWRRNGAPLCERHYVDLIMQGLQIEWGKDGQRREELYLDGVLYESKTYYDGMVIRHTVYDSQYETVRDLHHDYAKTLTTFKNGVKHGDGRLWNSAGDLIFHAKYQNDTLMPDIVCTEPSVPGRCMYWLDNDTADYYYCWDGSPFCTERMKDGKQIALTNTILAGKKRVLHGVQIVAESKEPVYYVLGKKIERIEYIIRLEAASSVIYSVLPTPQELCCLITEFADILHRTDDLVSVERSSSRYNSL